MKTKRIALLCVSLVLLMTMAPFAQAEEKPVLYRGITTTIYGMHSTTGVYFDATVQRPKPDTKRMNTLQAGTPIDIVDVLPNYVEIRQGSKTGFVLRHRIENVQPVNPATTPPYGVTAMRYYTTLDKETVVRAEAEAGADVLITLQAGTRLAFMDVNNGWAQLIFKRRYGYVNTADLPELRMPAPTMEQANDDVPLAVFNSFYDISTTGSNPNRMINLAVCGERTERVMQPGETLDFNRSVGPFNARNGYVKANSLYEGEVVLSTGGGSCQASSTLYNAVLQLPGLTITARAPHGANGMPYLPHGMDASSGDLNFIFRNDYDFAVRLETHVQDGAYFIAIYKA